MQSPPPHRLSRSVVVGLGLLNAATFAVILLARPANEAPAATATLGVIAPPIHPVVAVGELTATPTAWLRETNSGDQASAKPLLPDLEVQVEAMGATPARQEVALTHTSADLGTNVILQRPANVAGRVRFARATCSPTEPGGVVCVDACFPTVGAYAMQLNDRSERAVVFLPEQGRVRVAVQEADGASLHGSARAELRVLTATPPADRLHVYEITGGHVDIPVEAAGLLLQLQIVTNDGRRAEPVTTTGPVLAAAETDCVVTMAPRKMFTARIYDPFGNPMAHATVGVSLARTTIRLDEGKRTDEFGVVEFPAPQRSTTQAWPLTIQARSRDGGLLQGQLLADLTPGAPKRLGDVWLQHTERLVAGTCVDEDGQPLANITLYVQLECAQQPLRDGFLGGDGWRDLGQRPTTTGADGTFSIYGPPPQGQPLRLRVRGRPDLLTPFAAHTDDLSIVLPPKRSRLSRHRQ
tara:strand:- start:43563 stop:44963 length:1401 start_codon:yes stop_codon:yes gene_type:complete